MLLAAHVLANAQFPQSAKAIQSTSSMQMLASDVEHALLFALRKLLLRTEKNLNWICLPDSGRFFRLFVLDFPYGI